MNRLYYLKHAVATVETGPYNPQIEKIDANLDYDSNESVYRLFDDLYEFPLQNPQIYHAILKSGAKLTDLLSSSIFVLLGFLINHNLKNLFEKFKLPESKSYEVPVEAEQVIYDYFWLHMLYKYSGLTFEEIQNKHILFSGSQFFLEKHLSKVSDVSIKTIDDLGSKNKNLKISESIKATKITLDKMFLAEMPDVFKIPLLSTNWIIKEEVKNKIIKENITGVEIYEVKNVFFV